jgi:hypothetical protein
MKYLLLIVFCYSTCFHFELQGDNEKCFIEDFFEHTVVILHYEVIDFDIAQRNGKALFK